MPGPFYNAIKGTTAGTPGTGALTPNAASSGFLAWSTVPTGWIGLVRYEDGSAWELQYSYWNGTTLSRSATAQFVSSSTGSGLTLTSSATAAMIADANEIAADSLSTSPRGWVGVPANTTTPTSIGAPTVTVTGTAGVGSFGSGSYLARQPRSLTTSATTANAQAAYSSTGSFGITASASGIGGWAFGCRFGASTLPTGPRLFVGITGTTMIANTGEPSALTANYAVLGLDSTDTNLQIMVNSNVGSATKTDTGIPLAAGGWYEITLWSEPGSLTVYYLLVRFDTGAIFYGSTATDVPVTGSAIMLNCVGGLNGTNTGTAFVLNMGHVLIRTVA